MNFVLLFGLFTPIMSSIFRHDPLYHLIEIPLENVTTEEITSFLNLPTLPADESEIEYFDGERLKIWASSNQQKKLLQSNFVHYIGVDENEINFEEAKRQNYTDPTNGTSPDWTKYCDTSCWSARAKDLAANCAYKAEIEIYGKSVSGRDLIALKIGTVTPAKGPILLGGNIHGNEPVGGQLVQRYAYETCYSPSDEQKKIATSTIVWYLPFFNPDGYESHRRENANGADLNRNFPVIRTPSPQPETTAYMKFATKIKPSYSTMYHGGLAFAMYPYFDCYDRTIIPKCPPGDVPSSQARYQDYKTATNVYAGGMKKSGFRCDTSDCKCNVVNNKYHKGTGILADWAAAHNDQVDITVEVDHAMWPSGSQLPHYYSIHQPIINDYCLLSIS